LCAETVRNRQLSNFGKNLMPSEARETEQKMTDDERFAMVISLSGATRFSS
jgi:hypothetical protein